MFSRNIFKNVLICNSKNAIGIRGMCAELPRSHSVIKPENIQVHICGEIAETPTVTKNNNLAINVRTRTNDERYETHNVFLTNQNLLRKFSHCLEEGQRVYVKGILQPRQILYETEDDKQKHITKYTTIIPLQFYVVQQNAAITPENSDFNKVALCGNVNQEAQDTENVTFIQVQTKQVVKDDDNTYKNQYKHFNVSATEPNLRQMFRELKNNDLITVHGAIGYHKKMFNEHTLRNLKIKAEKLILHEEANKTL